MNRKRLELIAILTLVLAMAFAASPALGAKGGKAPEDTRPGHYIVVLQGDASPEGVAQDHGA